LLNDNIDNVEDGIFNADNDHADHERVDRSINIDASLVLCIELGSGDMINIDEDTNVLVNIDPFLVVDAVYVDYNS
jgi:hypothetical protein